MASRQDARQRAERAAALNARGYTWQSVAEICGYRSRQGAQQAVKRLDCRVPAENIEALRRQEDRELTIRRQMFHEKLTAANSENDTETMAMLNRELDRIAQRRARLLGLDAPVRSEVDVNVHQSATAIIADARDRLLSVIDAEVVDPKALTG